MQFNQPSASTPSSRAHAVHSETNAIHADFRREAVRTIEEQMLWRLVQHGCWADEAHAAVDAVKAGDDPTIRHMNRDWKARCGDYPAGVLELMWDVVRQTAIEQLKAKNPKHFAIPVLENYGT